MVSGAMHTTADTIRPAFQFINNQTGMLVVSSVMLMCLNDRGLLMATVLLIRIRHAEQLAEIAISSAKTAALFGIQPLVAMLSYSPVNPERDEQVDKVRKGY